MTTRTDWLELKLPPVALTVLFGCLAGVMAHATGGIALPDVSSPRAWAAIALAWIGALIAVCGVAWFRRARTTVNPITPEATSTLVTDGIYRVSRNPMYLGFLLMLAGWVLLLGSLASAVVLPAFAGYLTRFQIVPEERILAARFGPAFDEYQARVRRWI